MTWAELLVLNGGGRLSKREELEASLDRSIIALSKVARGLSKLRKQELKSLLDTLRLIQDYRFCFPRTDAVNQELANHAQELLDEL